MQRLDRILAVVDPTADAQPALDKARLLAGRCGATLDLFLCDFDPSLSVRPFADTDRLRALREAFVARRSAFLEERAAELRAQGIPTETSVRWDHPVHRGIVRRVRESSPDLVVKDTHYHSVLRRTLFTNTDWNLIRDCPAPLLLTKPAEWSAAPRILAALDPEHLGDKPAALDHDLLDWGNGLAATLDGELYAVHAFFPAALLAAATGAADLPLLAGATADAMVATERARVAEVLAGVVREHGIAAERVLLEQGSAVEVLPRVADILRADLLVMGAVSRGRLQEIFVGSTAERVLDRLPCDVLVVKPGDFAAGQPFQV